MRCIFCGEEGELTNEHVLSKPVRRLMGVGLDTGIKTDGDTRAWAGAPVKSGTVADLVVRCVCGPCNERWMASLDRRFASDLKWWSQHGSARLGSDRLDVVRRYVGKFLWVGWLGESWASAEETWLRGLGEMPAFMPLAWGSATGEIHGSRELEVMARQLSVAVARVAPTASKVISMEPVAVDGLSPRSNAGRVNAGVALTFRALGIRLYGLMSSIGDKYRPVWPGAIRGLEAKTRSGSLRAVKARLDPAFRLSWCGAGPAPDLAQEMEVALSDAQRIATESE